MTHTFDHVPKKGDSSTRSSSIPPATATTAQSENELLSNKIEARPEVARNIEVFAPDSPIEYLNGMKLYLVLLGVGLVVFLMMLDQTIVVTAIPEITGTFDSLKDIGWYGSAYMLTLASLQPLIGKVYQHYNSKVVFISCLTVFEAGSLICALAPESWVLIVGRAISGAGGSGLVIGFLTILSVAAPLDKRPFYMGIVMGVSSLGLVLGPILGGVFTEHASWRWCFWLNLPFGGVTLAILLFIQIPNGGKEGTTKATLKEQFDRLDIPGFVIFVPATIMLLLAFEWGGVRYPWKSATIIGLFCGAVGTCVVFFLWEKRQGMVAMIPLPMLKNKVMIYASITMTMSQGSLLVITFYLPVWFQVVKNATPTMGGVYFMPSVGGQVFGAVITGALTSRTGWYTPWAIAGLALTSLASGLLSIMTPSSGPGLWVTFQLISGFSRGLTMQQPLTAIQATLPKAEFAVGNAFLMFSQILGGAIFVSLGQTIFSNQLPSALAHFAPNVDAAAVLKVGATAFRKVIQPEDMPSVLLAYNQALTRVYYLGAAAAAAGFFTSWGLGFKNLKVLKEEEERARGAQSTAKTEDSA